MDEPIYENWDSQPTTQERELSWLDELINEIPDKSGATGVLSEEVQKKYYGNLKFVWCEWFYEEIWLMINDINILIEKA